jgi:hypothetical protein
MDMDKLIELKLAGKTKVLETHLSVALSAKRSTLFDLVSNLVIRLSPGTAVIQINCYLFAC